MTTRLLLVLLLLAACVSIAPAQERISLTASETAVANTKYRVDHLLFTENDPDTASIDEGVIVIQLIGIERRISVSCVYSSTTTPTATTLITALNTANLSSAYNNNASTGSLKQRIFHRLVIMNEAPAVCGKSLAGTLTGTPQ